MTVICLIFLVIWMISATDYEYQEKYFTIPDDTGQYHLVYLEDIDDIDEDIDNIEKINVEFHLYTRRNFDYSQILVYGNISSVKTSYFMKEKPTKFIVHGWNGGLHISPMNTILKEEFLAHGDYNIICVDWSAVGSILNYGYVGWVYLMPKAAKTAGDFLNWLIKKSMLRAADIHILGFSLGGHLAGNIARNIKYGKVPYITGLDPAGPMFTEKDSGRLSHKDGEYVEIIHTSVIGLKEPMGHTDFYPNYGKIMPGCNRIQFFKEEFTRGFTYCSHTRAYEYMAETINDDRFIAIKCKSFQEVSNEKCSKTGSLRMGGVEPKKGKTGIYYLKTAVSSPFIIFNIPNISYKTRLLDLFNLNALFF